MSRSLSPRVVAILACMCAVLGGCATTVSSLDGATFGDTTVIIDAPLPIVHSEGTAIAGWSSITMRETSDDDLVSPVKSSGAYKLDSGDKLRVFVYAQPSLSRIYIVDNEGYISVPLVGNIQARGASTRRLESILKAKLGSEFVRDPHVTVDIQQYRPFFILGEIRTAGQYPYIGGLTVDAAVAVAGGFSDRANERKVQITRRINGVVEKIEVGGDAEVRPGDTIFVKERWF